MYELPWDSVGYKGFNGSQLICDIQPDPTVPHVIRRLICQFTRSTSSYLKPQEEETKQNSIRYLSCALYSHTPEARTSIETCFLIPLSCIPAFKIHTHGVCGYVAILEYFCFKPWRRANGYHTSNNVQTLPIVMPVNVLLQSYRKWK